MTVKQILKINNNNKVKGKILKDFERLKFLEKKFPWLTIKKQEWEDKNSISKT